jgi:hypothetical protein
MIFPHYPIYHSDSHPDGVLTTVRVAVPGGLCNAALNGNIGFVVHRCQEQTLVLLLDGPSAGRLWWFNPSDLVVTYGHELPEAPRRAGA